VNFMLAGAKEAEAGVAAWQPHSNSTPDPVSSFLDVYIPLHSLEILAKQCRFLDVCTSLACFEWKDDEMHCNTSDFDFLSCYNAYVMYARTVLPLIKVSYCLAKQSRKSDNSLPQLIVSRFLAGMLLIWRTETP